MSGDLIDTTQMYLRTIYELEEEGIVPLRARIAERLHQAGPTVSQTVTRMERDGLVQVEGDRHLALTATGRKQAVRVMRKHRLAERLLIDVIGLDWEIAHNEACRWEHVISDDVERRLIGILDNPTTSPYGNPIPGLAELADDLPADGAQSVDSKSTDTGTSLEKLVTTAGTCTVHILRISEEVQKDAAAMGVLRRAGALPGRTVTARMTPDGTWVGNDNAGGLLLDDLAQHIVVAPAT